MKRGQVAGALAVVVGVLIALTATTAPAQQTTTTTRAPTAPPSTAATATTVSPGLTATSVRVAGLGWALAYGGADVGARARFARANAAGGVNGRTINYLGFRDDGGDPTASKNLAAQLATQDRVFAVVPAVSPVLATAGLAAADVPYFGWALSSEFCSTTIGFGFNGCLVPAGGTVTSGAWGQLIAQALGGSGQGKSAAVLTENSVSGAYALRSVAAGVRSAGFTVALADQALPVPAVGDYGALADKVMKSNAGKAPDVVFAVASYSNLLLARQALAAAGFVGTFTDPIEYDPQLVASAAGVMVFLPTAPAESSATVPAMKQLVDDVRKLAPTQAIDQAVIAGYLSADFFLQVLDQRPEGLSTKSFVKAANRFVFAVPDVVGPTRFPKARQSPVPCGSVVQSDGVTFKVRVPYTCGKVIPVG